MVCEDLFTSVDMVASVWMNKCGGCGGRSSTGATTS